MWQKFRRLAGGLLFLAVLAALIHSCGGFGVIVVTGQQYDYHIPRRFDAADGSSLYGNITGLAGLDSGEREAYLRTTSRDLQIPEFGEEWEVTWHLYWDKDYSAVLQSEKKWILRDAERGGQVAGFYHYHEDLGDTRYDRYYSFDPELGPRQWKNGEYSVTVKSPSMKTGCRLSTVYDGIAIDFSTIDEHLCRVGQFPLLYRMVQKIMRGWRVEKRRESSGQAGARGGMN